MIIKKQHTHQRFHASSLLPTWLQHDWGTASHAGGRSSGCEVCVNCTPAKGRTHMPANDVFCVHVPAADVAPAAH